MNTIHSIYSCYRSAVGSSLSFKSLFRLQNEGWDRIFTITDRHHSKSTGQWTRNHNILLWHCYRVSHAPWRTKSLYDRSTLEWSFLLFYYIFIILVVNVRLLLLWTNTSLVSFSLNKIYISGNCPKSSFSYYAINGFECVGLLGNCFKGKLSVLPECLKVALFHVATILEVQTPNRKQ